MIRGFSSIYQCWNLSKTDFETLLPDFVATRGIVRLQISLEGEKVI